jgi:hypothetical protein
MNAAVLVDPMEYRRHPGERFDQAAVPETIVCDDGKAYLQRILLPVPRVSPGQPPPVTLWGARVILARHPGVVVMRPDAGAVAGGAARRLGAGGVWQT